MTLWGGALLDLLIYVSLKWSGHINQLAKEYIMLILKVFYWNMRRSSVSKMRIIIKRTLSIKSASYIKPPSEWNIQVVTKHENFLGLHRIRFWWTESLCKRFSRLPCPKGYLNPFRAPETLLNVFYRLSSDSSPKEQQQNYQRYVRNDSARRSRTTERSELVSEEAECLRCSIWIRTLWSDLILWFCWFQLKKFTMRSILFF